MAGPVLPLLHVATLSIAIDVAVCRTGWHPGRFRLNRVYIPIFSVSRVLDPGHPKRCPCGNWLCSVSSSGAAGGLDSNRHKEWRHRQRRHWQSPLFIAIAGHGESANSSPMVCGGKHDVEFDSRLPNSLDSGDGDLRLVLHADLARHVPGTIRLFLARALFSRDLAVGTYIPRGFVLGPGENNSLGLGDKSNQSIFRIAAKEFRRGSE